MLAHWIVPQLATGKLLLCTNSITVGASTWMHTNPTVDLFGCTGEIGPSFKACQSRAKTIGPIQTNILKEIHGTETRRNRHEADSPKVSVTRTFWL